MSRELGYGGNAQYSPALDRRLRRHATHLAIASSPAAAVAGVAKSPWKESPLGLTAHKSHFDMNAATVAVGVARTSGVGDRELPNKPCIPHPPRNDMNLLHASAGVAKSPMLTRARKRTPRQSTASNSMSMKHECRMDKTELAMKRPTSLRYVHQSWAYDANKGPVFVPKLDRLDSKPKECDAIYFFDEDACSGRGATADAAGGATATRRHFHTGPGMQKVQNLRPRPVHQTTHTHTRSRSAPRPRQRPISAIRPATGHKGTRRCNDLDLAGDDDFEGVGPLLDSDDFHEFQNDVDAIHDDDLDGYELNYRDHYNKSNNIMNDGTFDGSTNTVILDFGRDTLSRCDQQRRYNFASSLRFGADVGPTPGELINDRAPDRSNTIDLEIRYSEGNIGRSFTSMYGAAPPAPLDQFEEKVDAMRQRAEERRRTVHGYKPRSGQRPVTADARMDNARPAAVQTGNDNDSNDAQTCKTTKTISKSPQHVPNGATTGTPAYRGDVEILASTPRHADASMPGREVGNGTPDGHGRDRTPRAIPNGNDGNVTGTSPTKAAGLPPRPKTASRVAVSPRIEALSTPIRRYQRPPHFVAPKMNLSATDTEKGGVGHVAVGPNQNSPNASGGATVQVATKDEEQSANERRQHKILTMFDDAAKEREPMMQVMSATGTQSGDEQLVKMLSARPRSAIEFRNMKHSAVSPQVIREERERTMMDLNQLREDRLKNHRALTELSRTSMQARLDAKDVDFRQRRAVIARAPLEHRQSMWLTHHFAVSFYSKVLRVIAQSREERNQDACEPQPVELSLSFEYESLPDILRHMSVCLIATTVFRKAGRFSCESRVSRMLSAASAKMLALLTVQQERLRLQRASHQHQLQRRFRARVESDSEDTNKLTDAHVTDGESLGKGKKPSVTAKFKCTKSKTNTQRSHDTQQAQTSLAHERANDAAEGGTELIIVPMTSQQTLVLMRWVLRFQIRRRAAIVQVSVDAMKNFLMDVHSRPPLRLIMIRFVAKVKKCQHYWRAALFSHRTHLACMHQQLVAADYVSAVERVRLALKEIMSQPRGALSILQNGPTRADFAAVERADRGWIRTCSTLAGQVSAMFGGPTAIEATLMHETVRKMIEDEMTPPVLLLQVASRELEQRQHLFRQARVRHTDSMRLWGELIAQHQALRESLLEFDSETVKRILSTKECVGASDIITAALKDPPLPPFFPMHIRRSRIAALLSASLFLVREEAKGNIDPLPPGGPHFSVEMDRCIEEFRNRLADPVNEVVSSCGRNCKQRIMDYVFYVVQADEKRHQTQSNKWEAQQSKLRSHTRK